MAPLPTAEPGYKERMAFSDTHEKVDEDIIEVGGDTADIDAAAAEMEQEKIKEQKGHLLWTYTICMWRKCV